MKSKHTWMVLAAVAATIKLFSLFPGLVERFYSTGAYPVIAQTLRLLFGWIPFSLGDVLYSLAFLYGARKLFGLVRLIAKKQVTSKVLTRLAQKTAFVCLSIYIAFNLLWGLNYNRIPMARQAGLTPSPYSTQNLELVAQALVDKLNAFDAADTIARLKLDKKKFLFQEAVQTYALAKNQYPLLQYQVVSVKPSIFSYAGNYIGFSGYYNPFTGEAQANTTVPSFIQPFTVCHEIGHQLGYAKENEANFAGFLSCRLSADKAFRYSVYFDMYQYVFSEMYKRDSLLAKGFSSRLHSNIRRDYTTIRAFFRRYENPFGEAVWKLYAHYLRANQQPSGLHSYNEVVAMLVAFYRRYGIV